MSYTLQYSLIRRWHVGENTGARHDNLKHPVCNVCVCVCVKTHAPKLRNIRQTDIGQNMNSALLYNIKTNSKSFLMNGTMHIFFQLNHTVVNAQKKIG